MMMMMICQKKKGEDSWSEKEKENMGEESKKGTDDMSFNFGKVFKECRERKKEQQKKEGEMMEHDE